MNTEYKRLSVLIICFIGLGLLARNWWLAIAVPLGICCAWQFFKLIQIEQWLEKGAKKRNTPESSGLWESIIAHVLKLKTGQKTHKTRLTKAIKNYRDTVLALPDAAIVLNENLEIQWSNEHASYLLGIVFSRDQGYRITNLIRSPEFIKLLSSAHTTPLEIDSPVNSDVTLSIHVTHYGRNQHLLLARDISDRIRIRHALQHFIADASHELRTPLTVTSGYVDIIQADPELPENLHQPIQQIRDKTDDMTQLIDNLLTLSKVEAGQPESPEEDIDVAKIITFITHEALRAKPGLIFKLDLDSRLGLRGIASGIYSICNNLIDNASKHTATGTEICISWTRNKSQQAQLTVSDNGAGFDEKYIDLISKRFYRINANQNLETKGSGLGLAIVKHNVKQHGGELKIESKPGKGASFSVIFPVSRCIKKLNLDDSF